jgi:NADPH-ferrihemoprotein reductase
MENLDSVSEDCVAIFVMSVYGEGEPTDNARPFMDFIVDPAVHFSLGGHSLEKLNYVIFGLGNSTYTHYNRVSRTLDARLQELGATRVGERGEGDDNGSIEEDYLAWQEGMWTALATRLDLKEGGSTEVHDFEVQEQRDIREQDVYQGELSAQALLSQTADAGGSTDSFGAQNPYPAPITKSHDLFAISADRSCLHMEFDIANTGISYEAGDHLGVWPINPDIEVDRMLGILGLTHCRNTPVFVKALDPSIAKVPFPVPSTYDAIFRHYLDISSLAPRQTIAALAKFAPSKQAEGMLIEWSRNRDQYRSNVQEPGFNLGEVLQVASGYEFSTTSPSSLWKIPFDRVISEIPRLQPRFYSISSSPKLYPDSVHISAVVLRYQSASLQHQSRYLHGLSTNFLLNINLAKLSREEGSAKHGLQSTPVYSLGGPRGKHIVGGVHRIPIHIRRSTFRLPASPKIPVIMIGPGTVSRHPAYCSQIYIYAAAEEDAGRGALSRIRARTSSSSSAGSRTTWSRCSIGLGAFVSLLWLPESRRGFPLPRRVARIRSGT